MMGCAGLAFWVVILWGVVWECCFSGFIIIPLLSCIILLSVTFGCVTRQGLVIDPVVVPPSMGIVHCQMCMFIALIALEDENSPG